MKKGDRVVAKMNLGSDNPFKWSTIPKGTQGIITKVNLLKISYDYEVMFSGPGIICKEPYPCVKGEIKKA